MLDILGFLALILIIAYFAVAYLMGSKDAAGKVVWAWKWPLALFQSAP